MYGEIHSGKLGTFLNYDDFKAVAETAAHESWKVEHQINSLCSTRTGYYLFSARRQAMVETMVNNKVISYLIRIQMS